MSKLETVNRVLQQAEAVAESLGVFLDDLVSAAAIHCTQPLSKPFEPLSYCELARIAREYDKEES